MRYILSIFLFSILIQNIITEQDILDRMARAAIALRNIVKYKQEQMRKLQVNTYTPAIVVTVPTDLPEETKKKAEATLNPEPEPKTVMPEPPNIGNNSTTPSTYPENLIQIRKFHKFQKPKGEKRLNFGAFLYFLNRIIPKNVIMRVVIRYSSRRTLRGLDDNNIDAESVRTVCELKDAYKEYEGQVGNGTNVDYDCNAETSKDKEVEEAKIDTEKPMVVGNESIPVSEIDFHPDSATGAENLVKENSEQEIGVLSIEGVKTSEQNLTLTGKVMPNTLPLKGPYDIDFYDTERGEMKTLNCKADKNGDDFTLVCDTSKNPLTTNYGNLTLSKIETDDLYASFNIPEDEKIETEIRAGGSGNNIYYRKNSSGLSGGAIAGIVIACVVVLAAASIAAIMLRKPSPPIDNTTVVGLKTVENV